MPSPRFKIAGSERKPIQNAQPVTGPGSVPDPNENVEITISIRSKSKIPDWVANSGVVSREQLASDYGSSASDMMAVEKFAQQYHLHVLEVNALFSTMKVSGNIQNLEKAFGTKLKNVKASGRIYRERTGHLTVPAEISSIVTGVFGLDNRKVSNYRFRRSPAPHIAQSFTPDQVARLYNFPDGDGTGETVAILEFDGGYSISDMNTYFSGLGLATPNITAVSIDGAKNTPKPAKNQNDPDPDGEVALDIQVVGAIVPKADINVYFAPNTTKGWIDGIQKIIQDNPTVVSISWGAPENSAFWTASVMTKIESLLTLAAAHSIPVAVASGDNGSTDGTSALVVDFPAAAPHALGCGGTNLEGSGSTISNEVVWNSLTPNNTRIATGGGVSTVFTKPTYQNGVTVPGSGRGVPDVSGDADPSTGYQIFYDGKAAATGGTSAVAPLWSALITLLAQNLNQKVPFLNPILYSNPGALRDITSGNNDVGNGGGNFTATVGWDACTGLGSPNGKTLLNVLKGTTTSLTKTSTSNTPSPSHSSTPTNTTTRTPTNTTTNTPSHTTTNTPSHTTTNTPTHTTTHTPTHTTTHTPTHTTTHTPTHTTTHTPTHTTATPPKTTSPTPPPTSTPIGSSGSSGAQFIHPGHGGYEEIPSSYEPRPVAPAGWPTAPSPAGGLPPQGPMGLQTFGGLPISSDAQVAMVALASTVANVANTAITAITSITAIAVNNKK